MITAYRCLRAERGSTDSGRSKPRNLFYRPGVKSPKISIIILFFIFKLSQVFCSFEETTGTQKTNMWKMTYKLCALYERHSKKPDIVGDI